MFYQFISSFNAYVFAFSYLIQMVSPKTRDQTTYRLNVAIFIDIVDTIRCKQIPWRDQNKLFNSGTNNVEKPSYYWNKDVIWSVSD